MNDTIMAIAPRQQPDSLSPPRLLRVGAVSYLNSKPLIAGLEDSPLCELSLDYPSRLADDLADGSLDVALIPSVECLRNPEYEVISDACVATLGNVMSVKLYSRVKPGSIKTLALDEGSRTSAALVQTYLSHKYGVEPDVCPLPLEADNLDADADAILIIGDRAMHAPAEQFHTVWDMGHQWRDWTGLPFVFAVWAARPNIDVSELEKELSSARDRGIQQIEQIAEEEAAPLRLSVETASNYLKHNLHFHLGAAERHGFRLFQELATEAGLIAGGTEIVFHTK
ncbi:MAG: menaquinone biosynthesis protein [Planctomycetaceae bacterium]|jgi:chorismate dehydratase|nr:menaquinone biosynthesis protein [Planctomycetaceae bacterium]